MCTIKETSGNEFDIYPKVRGNKIFKTRKTNFEWLERETIPLGLEGRKGFGRENYRPSFPPCLPFPSPTSLYTITPKQWEQKEDQ
jgi:hypothetical protein